jgi:hypothetical protein
MLSPHEIAALILVKGSPMPVDLDPADLDTLLEQQLVELEQRPYGRTCPQLTHRGDFLLNAVTRNR